MSADKSAFQASVDVSRETMERLEIYADLLNRWTKRINLVAPSTLSALWQRHFLDSAQLCRFATAGEWLDVGSGGGFPGAVIAIMCAETPVTLVESDQRKAAFLRAVARETGVGFAVHAERIESLAPQHSDRLSARALAPLSDLLVIAERHLSIQGKAILMKGASAQKEIDEALEHWSFDCETYASKTDADAVILSIGNIKRV
jgi:16S rRNA (guanine527-N7)-methyltransferase